MKSSAWAWDLSSFELIQPIAVVRIYSYINRYTSDSDYTLTWTAILKLRSKHFHNKFITIPSKTLHWFQLMFVTKLWIRIPKNIETDFLKIRPFFIKGTKNHLNRSCWKKQFKNTTNTHCYSLCINTLSPQKKLRKATPFRSFFFFFFKGRERLYTGYTYINRFRSA